MRENSAPIPGVPAGNLHWNGLGSTAKGLGSTARAQNPVGGLRLARSLSGPHRNTPALDPAHLMGEQDEQKQQHRQSDPHAKSPRRVPGFALVTHHEEQGGTQTRDDAKKCHTNDDLHPAKYRMRPKALIPALAAVVVILLTAALGRWQLQRADEKARAASQREAALAQAPVQLTPGLRPAGLEGALLDVRGTWVADKTIFLDNRTRKGVAGFHVVTPLRLEALEGRDVMHVLVLRGWVARDVIDRTRLPSITTPEVPVRLEGLGLQTLAQPMRLARGSDVDPDTPRIWQHLDPDHYAKWSGLALHPLMVRQLSDTNDALMRDWTLPGSGEDKHRAYAFQWFAMSAVTALLWVGLTWRRRVKAHS